MRRLMMLTLLLSVSCGRGPRLDIDQWDDLSAPSLLSLPETVWTSRLPSPVATLLPVGDDRTLMLSHRGELYLLDMEKGTRKGKLWQPMKHGITAYVLDAEAHILYFASAREKELRAYDLTRGRTLWKRQRAGITGPMALRGAYLYCSTLNGVVAAYHIADGAAVEPFNGRGRYYGGVLSSGEMLVTLSDGGVLYGFNPLQADEEETGALSLTPVWQRKLPLAPSAVMSAYADGILAADSKGTLLLLDGRSGEIRYKIQLEAPVFAAPVIAGEMVIIGAADGQILALALADGSLRWRTEAAGLIKQPLHLLGNPAGSVLALYARGQLAAYSIDDGELLWRYEHERPLKALGLTGEGILLVDIKNRLTYLHPDAPASD